MVGARDPEALEQEKAKLRDIDSRPGLWRRWRGYWSLSGPGWVQSALTLGAGSAGSSIFAGAVFGYDLLWVQPVAMFLGVVVFSAIGHQLLVTQARPYDVFRKKLHPALAWAWGGVVLLASIIWQFPQYALATSVSRDIFDVAGLDVPRAPIALGLLVAATALCWSYGQGSRRAIRLFERTLKYLVLLMSLFFLLVVIKTGIDLKALVHGLFGFHIPRDREGLTIVLGALGAAVGVNMTFLYPYTLLARGWGREHRGLKNFDLIVSMFAPFVLTTSLVVDRLRQHPPRPGHPRPRGRRRRARPGASGRGRRRPGHLLARRPGHVFHDPDDRDGHLRLRPERDAGLRAPGLAVPGGDHDGQYRHPRRVLSGPVLAARPGVVDRAGHDAHRLCRLFHPP